MGTWSHLKESYFGSQVISHHGGGVKNYDPVCTPYFIPLLSAFIISHTTGGTIGGYVWADTNGNGLQDDWEAGLPNITVELRFNSTVIATTTTDSTGHYVFEDVPAGTYTIVVLPPNGYIFTTPEAGNNSLLDSNVINTVTGETSAIVVGPGETVGDVDVGLYPGVSGHGSNDKKVAHFFSGGRVVHFHRLHFCLLVPFYNSLCTDSREPWHPVSPSS